MQVLTIVGNLGKDAQTKQFDNGGYVINFPLADTERGYKTATGKEIPEHTEWFNVSYRCSNAGLAQYLTQGRKVAINGKLHTRSYEDNGVTKYITEVVARTIELMPMGDKTDHPISQALNEAKAQDDLVNQITDQLPF